MNENRIKPQKFVFLANFSRENAQHLVFQPKIDDKNHHFWEIFQLYKNKILINFDKTVKLTADKLTDLTVIHIQIT